MKLDKNEIIKVLLAKIGHQTKKISELKARLNQNSKNRSMPPSTDLFTKPKSLHKQSEKKAEVKALIDRLVLRKDQWLLFFADFCV